MLVSNDPIISIIIPTYNRRQVLPSLIQALEAQDYPRNQYEILIADDGSSDGTAEYLKTRESAVRLLAQSHGGASRARNLAASNARGLILAFTDDDCRPERDWLRVIHGFMEQHKYMVTLLGCTYSEHPSSTFVHSVHKNAEPLVTCNCAVARKAFELVGGFDDHFVVYFEDEDLGLRLKKAGYPIVFEPEMRVLHPSRYQSFRKFIQTRSHLQYFCYMSQKHPDCDHWKRHRGVIKQIGKKTLVFGLPLLVSLVWPPAIVISFFALLAHLLVDARRARQQSRELAKIGFHLQARDFLAFTTLNWAIPFVDAYRILKGCIHDMGKSQPWLPPNQTI